MFVSAADPLEMDNLASVAGASGDLVRMRSIYDNLVDDWKTNAVPYHDYQAFGDVFSRN